MRPNPWIAPILGIFVTLAVTTTHQLPLTAQVTQAREPMMTMPVSATGNVTVRLVNQTEQTLTYEALGDTQPRTLEADSEIVLQGLNVPATVTFFYKDVQKNRQAGEGLTEVLLTADDPADVLEVVVQPTTELDKDVSNLTVESNGNVFLF